jgi:hypothetical protein
MRTSEVTHPPIGQVLGSLSLASLAAIAVFDVIMATANAFKDHSANSGAAVVAHFTIFGAIVVFPFAYLVCLPVYLLFRWRGWATPSSVMIGATALGLVGGMYEFRPTALDFTLEQAGFYAASTICGLVGGWVFYRTAYNEEKKGSE